MKFSSKDIETIMLKSHTSMPAEMAVLHKSMVFEWYPGELNAMLKPAAGDDFIFRCTVYKADLFARSPLLHGYMLRIGSDKIFLFLYTS